MKSVTVIFLLLATCRAQVKDYLLSTECPGMPESCSCEIVEDVTQPGHFFRMATCATMPSKLHISIRSLKVLSLQIGTVSRHMIAGLGSELRQLDLSSCKITSIETGAFNTPLTYLKTLKLSNNSLSELQEDVFLCPNLLELHLDKNNLQHIPTGTFKQLKALKKLYLQHNNITTFSPYLPPVLEKLDVSHNYIQIADIDITKVSLQYLDLCYNAFQLFPLKTSKPSVHLRSLCLADAASQLPVRTAELLPGLTNLTLMGSPQQQSMLTITTQSELNKLINLTKLHIEYFHMQNLAPLRSLYKLIELTLLNVTVQNTGDLQEVFTKLKYLTSLNLDHSPQLMRPVLGNPSLLSHLSTLKTLSISDTKLVSLGKENVPQSVRTLDITDNPLSCDCNLAWLKTKLASTSRYFLNDINNTRCTSGVLLERFLNTTNCQESPGKLMQTQEYEPIMSTTAEPQKEPHQGGTSQGEEKSDHTTLYIVLGSCLLVLVIIGIVLVVVLSIMKKRRKCQITPEDGDTPMEQPQQQIKQASSKDMLVKK